MVTRKTQYGWMAMGGLICLLAVGLACKMREGNRAVAQEDKGPDVVGPPLPEMPKEMKPVGKATDLEPVVDPTRPLPPLPSSGPPLTDVAPPPPPAPPSGVKLEAPDLRPSMSYIVPAGFKEPAPKKEELAQGDKKEPSKPVPPPAVSKEDLPPPVPPMPPMGPKPGKPEAPAKPPESDPLVKPAPTVSPAPLPPDPVPPAVTAPDSPKPLEPPPPPKPTETTPKVAAPKAEKGPTAVPGEPPLAPAPGIVQTYQVRGKGETLREIAQRTMGTSERWSDIHKLNPMLNPEETIPAGTTVRLPGDACIPTEDVEPVKPLPALRKAPAAKPRAVLPLTGTFPVNLDDKKTLTLPKAIRKQFAGSDTLLLSPGPDQCLWLTNQAHLERLATRLDHSPAREADVRVFKRLYYAQTEKASLNAEGRVAIPERLAQFAGLHQEVVLIGIDDHFEVWDAVKWREYTKQKSAAKSSDTE